MVTRNPDQTSSGVKSVERGLNVLHSQHTHLPAKINMQRTTLTTLVLACAVVGAWGQFQFFEQMFGHGHPGQQQHRQPNQGSQWASHADAGLCSCSSLVVVR